jgi:hypothetical protein
MLVSSFSTILTVTDVQGHLPLSDERGNHVLVTTRKSEVLQIPAEGLEISELPETDAIDLLLQLSSPQVDETSMALARSIVCEDRT